MWGGVTLAGVPRAAYHGSYTMIYKFFHRSSGRLPLVAVVSVLVTSCDLPPEEVIEPDLRTVTLLFTGSIRGELHMCD